MTAEPIRYMIVCDHPEMGRRYFVADIDDHRLIGGRVHFQLYRGEMATTATALNNRGSRRVIPFACGVCRLRPEIAETSLPDLLDKIAPHRELLPVAVEPIEAAPSPLRDPDTWFDVLRGGDPGPGPVVGCERRHVISLRMLDDIVSKLRVRDRR
jgi:hypothetical protein